MDWVTDAIAIGNYLEATDAALHRSEGIRSLVCLDGKLRGAAPQNLGLEALEAFDMKDGSGNEPQLLKRAVAAVALLSKKHPKLLVQCHAGRSRSVIVVAAYLIKSRGWTADEALQFVGSKREVCITPGIEALLESEWKD